MRTVASRRCRICSLLIVAAICSGLLAAETASGPIMVFCPKTQLERGTKDFPKSGSIDFMSLFSANAPWSRAASLVQVFKCYGAFIQKFSDADLRMAFSDLARRGIKLGLATGGLTATDDYGKGIEGFGGQESLKLVQRIKDLGGDLRYINLDEPYTFGCRYSGVNAAHLPPERVAREVADFIAKVHAIFPDAEVGDAEAVGFSSITTTELEQWLQTYREVTGAPFPFYLGDTGWRRPHAFAEMRELQTWVQSHGMKFGTYYDGDPDDTSDAAWMAHAVEAFSCYERAGLRRPDQVQMQSWNDRPHYLLPETDPTRQTSIFLSYARAITDLQLSAHEDADHAGCAIRGRLVTEAGAPIPQATVTLMREITSDPGEPGTYSVSGEVPSWAVSAAISVRATGGADADADANADANAVEVTISKVHFAAPAERVSNGDFTAGLRGWQPEGKGAIEVVPAPKAGARIRATRKQPAGMTSDRFPVAAGTPYEFRVDACVPPSAADRGYFAVVFYSSTSAVGLRQKIPFAPARIPIETVTTGEDGTFSCHAALPTGAYGIVARFDGNAASRLTESSVPVEMAGSVHGK